MQKKQQNMDITYMAQRLVILYIDTTSFKPKKFSTNLYNANFKLEFKTISFMTLLRLPYFLTSNATCLLFKSAVRSSFFKQCTCFLVEQDK